MMKGVSRVLKAEFYKARRRRSSWLMPVAALLLTAGIFFAVDYAAQRDWMGVPGGWYLASSTAGWLVDITGLAVIVMACFSVSGEFSRGTVKPALTRGISRIGWFFGRVIAVCAASTVLFSVIAASALVLAAVFRGLPDLMEKDFLLHSSSRLFWSYVLCYVLTVVTLCAVASAASMVSTLVNRAGTAIAAGIMLAFAMTVLGVFDTLRPFLVSDALGLPMDQMVSMSKGLPLPYGWSELIRRTLLCAAGWSSVSLALGSAVIRRKEMTF